MFGAHGIKQAAAVVGVVLVLLAVLGASSAAAAGAPLGTSPATLPSPTRPAARARSTGRVAPPR